MPMTPREMIKYLKKNGFKTVGQNGSHVKMRLGIRPKLLIKHRLEKRSGAGYIETSRS